MFKLIARMLKYLTFCNFIIKYFYIIILMVQQNYFQISLAKFLDTSAKSFFPCDH